MNFGVRGPSHTAFNSPSWHPLHAVSHPSPPNTSYPTSTPPFKLITELLKHVREVLPTGQNQWKTVEGKFNAGRGKTSQRTWESLRSKYRAIKNKPKPTGRINFGYYCDILILYVHFCMPFTINTGQGEMPEIILAFKQVAKDIEANSAVIELEDAGLGEEDDDDEDEEEDGDAVHRSINGEDSDDYRPDALDDDPPSTSPPAYASNHPDRTGNESVASSSRSVTLDNDSSRNSPINVPVRGSSSSHSILESLATKASRPLTSASSSKKGKEPINRTGVSVALLEKMKDAPPISEASRRKRSIDASLERMSSSLTGMDPNMMFMLKMAEDRELREQKWREEMEERRLEREAKDRLEQEKAEERRAEREARSEMKFMMMMNFMMGKRDGVNRNLDVDEE